MGARALGAVTLASDVPVPSGTYVLGHVKERYDLRDASAVVPQPFTQDILLFSDPRNGDPTRLGASFAVTPSRDFSIVETFGTWGSSCRWRPTPCPTNSRTTENPALDSTEEWEIWNMTGDAHPVHLHLVHFEVLGRQARQPRPHLPQQGIRTIRHEGLRR